MPISRPLLSRNIWKPFVLPVSFVVLWTAFSICRPPSPGDLLVSPVTFLVSTATDIVNGALPGAILATIARASTGYFIGSAGGLLIGMIIGLSGAGRLLIAPTVDSARQIALFGWIPLLSAWLGNGEAMKVSLIALGAFFPVALATAAGCAGVARPYLEVGRVLELNRSTEIRKIILPAAAPMIVTGLELALNISWIGTIGAEYLIGTGYINGMGNGLGAYLAVAREFAHMDRVLIGVVALALVGLALDRSVAWTSRRIFPWQTR